MGPLGSITSTNNATAAQISETGKKPERQAGTVTESAAASATAAGIRLPEDQVSLSGRQPGEAAAENSSSTDEADSAKKEPKPGEKTTAEGKSLEDPQVQQQVARLKQIEEKVKAHEAAHKAVGGNLAGSASYSYTQGPDGRSYITGGEVQIDMSGGNTPQETISRMQQVIRAALAPADPSGQDRAVAAQAATQMAQAQQEKLQADSPTAEPDPTQPVDPAQEAIRTALSPEADREDEPKNPGAVSGRGTDSRVQQAYGDPAVQGAGQSGSGQGPDSSSQSPSDTGRRSNPFSGSAFSLISAFA